jgi:hypothetical protein
MLLIGSEGLHEKKRCVAIRSPQDLLASTPF